MHELTFTPPTNARGIPRVCIANCAKDGTIVAARLASVLGAVSSNRPLKIQPDRYTDSTYVNDVGNALANYYRLGLGSKLLADHTVVLSSVHRAALYIAEVLHAPLLPLQILSFSRGLEEAKKTPTLAIAGADYGVSRLWQWNKFSHSSHFPSEYVHMLSRAKRVVVVRSTDEETDCPLVGRNENVYFNTTLSKLNADLWVEIQKNNKLYPVGDISLKQWEWGLPDCTVDAARSIWSSLGKSDNNFHLIEGSTINLLKAIPAFWEKYLIHNSIDIRGVTLNAYWSAHPSYERLAGLIPVHFYKFALLRNTAKFHIQKYCKNCSPETLCAFINDVGGKGDCEEVRALLRNQGGSKKAWFSKGFDSPGARCVDIFGAAIPKPYEKVAKWLETAPYRCNEWVPLELDKLKEVMKTCSCNVSLGIGENISLS